MAVKNREESFYSPAVSPPRALIRLLSTKPLVDQFYSDSALLARTIPILKGAGEILMRHYQKGVRVKTKADKSLVTAADSESESFIRSELSYRFPHSSILGEEKGFSKGGNGLTWIVDPLDKTDFFARGIPLFKIKLALLNEGELAFSVVYSPLQRELYYAEKGKGAFLNGAPIRVSHVKDLKDAVVNFHFKRLKEPPSYFTSICREANRINSGLSAVYISNGRTDAYIHQLISSYDVLPNQLIIEEAGGRVTDFQGNPCDFGPDLLKKSPVLYSNGFLHDKLLSLINQEGSP